MKATKIVEDWAEKINLKAKLSLSVPRSRCGELFTKLSCFKAKQKLVLIPDHENQSLREKLAKFASLNKSKDRDEGLCS